MACNFATRGAAINKKNFQVLGEGSFGKVIFYLASKSESPVARKIFGDGNEHECKHELEMMVAVGEHPGIVAYKKHGQLPANFHDDEYAAQQFYIDYEYLSGKNAAQIFMDNYTFDGAFEHPMHMCKFVVTLMEAVNHMHKRGYLHLDIKPDNVMYTKEKRAKLVDLGMASKKEDQLQLNDHLGTLGYQPPEFWEGVLPDEKYDVFSLGALLYEMVYGVPAVTVTHIALAQMKRYIDEVDIVRKKLLEKDLQATQLAATNSIQFPPKVARRLKYPVPNDILAIMHLMLQKDPAKRPPLRELLFSNLFPSLFQGKFITEYLNEKNAAVAALTKEREVTEKLQKDLVELNRVAKLCDMHRTAKECSERLVVEREAKIDDLSTRLNEQKARCDDKVKAIEKLKKDHLSDTHDFDQQRKVLLAEFVQLKGRIEQLEGEAVCLKSTARHSEEEATLRAALDKSKERIQSLQLDSDRTFADYESMCNSHDDLGKELERIKAIHVVELASMISLKDKAVYDAVSEKKKLESELLSLEAAKRNELNELRELMHRQLASKENDLRTSHQLELESLRLENTRLESELRTFAALQPSTVPKYPEGGQLAECVDAADDLLEMAYMDMPATAPPTVPQHVTENQLWSVVPAAYVDTESCGIEVEIIGVSNSKDANNNNKKLTSNTSRPSKRRRLEHACDTPASIKHLPAEYIDAIRVTTTNLIDSLENPDDAWTVLDWVWGLKVLKKDIHDDWPAALDRLRRSADEKITGVNSFESWLAAALVTIQMHFNISPNTQYVAIWTLATGRAPNSWATVKQRASSLPEVLRYKK